MFSFEYCEMFKNTYFEEHLLTAVSDILRTATEQPCAASSVLDLNLDNLLTQTRRCMGVGGNF